MKKRMMVSLVLFVASIIVAIPTTAGASGVTIKDVHVYDRILDCGDDLRVSVEFNLPSSRTYNAELDFYVDGRYIGSARENIREGESYLYSFRTEELSKGNHVLRIKAKIYDHFLVGRDTEYITFYMRVHCESTSRYRPFAHVDLNLPSTVRVNEGENLEIDFNFESSSDKKHEVRFRFYVDDVLVNGKSIYVRDGDRDVVVVKTSDIDVGVHELRIVSMIYKGYRYMGRDEKTITLIVKEEKAKRYYAGSLYPYRDVSLHMLPGDVVHDNIVQIYGYTYVDGRMENGYVNVYVNGNFVKKVESDESGYYSTSIYLPNMGYNVIEVSFGEARKSKTVELRREVQEVDEGTTITIEKDKVPISIIIVKDGKVERIYVDGDHEEENVSEDEEDIDYQYVDVSVSTKELTMNQHKGNILKVYVYNHMNSTKVFSLDTSFDDKWTYVSEPKIIKRGERDELSIYFKPLTDKRGKMKGKVFVKMNGEVIKEIPIELFVAGPLKEVDYEEGFNWNLVLWIALIVAALGLIGFVIYSFLSREKGYLAPLFPEVRKEELKDVVQKINNEINGAIESSANW